MIYEGFRLTLDCDFAEVADRRRCQVFYGREHMLEEEIAAYSFADDKSFERALEIATDLSRHPYFERLWSGRKFLDGNGGFLCLKRVSGPALLDEMQRTSRTRQLLLCHALCDAVTHLHDWGLAHGALDRDNVRFDAGLQVPVILEAVSGFYNDQVEPGLRAPEQRQAGEATRKTDIFWIANLYLKAIKRPPRRLRKLITWCSEANPKNRPDIHLLRDELAVCLADNWESRLVSLFRVKNLIRATGMVILLVALLTFFIENNPLTISPRRAEPTLLEQMRSNLFGVENSHQRIRMLREQAADADTGVRATLIEWVARELSEEDFPEFNSADSSHLGIFVFDNPVAIFEEGTVGLGSYVRSDSNMGHIYDIQSTGLFIQTDHGAALHRIENPDMSWLPLRNDGSVNIFIPGGRENMRLILSELAQFYGFELDDRGGRDGVIAGSFSFATVHDFLYACASELNLAFDGRKITIHESYDLRIWSPLIGKSFHTQSCEEFFVELSKPTGYEVQVDDACILPNYQLWVYESSWKGLLEYLGLGYRLEAGVETTRLTFVKEE